MKLKKRRKKALRILLILPLTAFIFASLSICVSAETANENDSLLSELNDILPDGVKELLPDKAEELLKSGDTDGLVKMIDCEFVLNLAGKTLAGLFGDVVKITAQIISIVICSAILRAACDGIEDKAICRVLESVSGICIILVMFKTLTAIWDKMSLAVMTVGAFATALSPMIVMLCTSGGCVTTGSVTAAFLSLLTALFEETTKAVLTPLLKTGICMIAVSSLSSVDLSGIVNFLKKTFITLITFSMAGLTAVMAYQSTLAQSADSMLLRTVKFAAGTFIPVVGPSVGEAAGSVLGGVSAIKTATGGIGAVAVLLVVLPPILQILLVRAGIGFASSVASVFGCAKEGKMIEDIGNLLDLSLALITACGVMFVISLAMLTKAVLL